MESLISIASLRDVRDRERKLCQKNLDFGEFTQTVLHALVLEKMFQPALEDPSPEIYDLLSVQGPLVARIYFQLTRAEAVVGYLNAISLEGDYDLLLHPDERGLIQSAELRLKPCDAVDQLDMPTEFLISRDDLINMVFDRDAYERVLVVLEQQMETRAEQNLVEALAEICDDNFDEWYRPDYLLLEYKDEKLILHYAEEAV
jgi:hypothetical protein